MFKSQKANLIAIAIFVACAGLLFAQEQRGAVFYFGGERFFIGMPQADAEAALSQCCKLSQRPRNAKQIAADTGRLPGQFILSKDESSPQIIGSIFFEDGRVSGLSRPLGEQEYTPWSADSVGLARTLYRALAPPSGDTDTRAVVSVRHERATNGETEVLSFTFSNGRGVRVNMIKLDRPLPGSPSDSKDQVTVEEFLEPAHKN